MTTDQAAPARARHLPDDAPAGAPVVDGFTHPGFRWLDDIACDEHELSAYFANAGHVLGEKPKEACMRCPVWRECLVFSYLGNPDGMVITGGYFAALSPGQRRKLTQPKALELVAQMRAEHAASTEAGGLEA